MDNWTVQVSDICSDYLEYHHAPPLAPFSLQNWYICPEMGGLPPLWELMNMIRYFYQGSVSFCNVITVNSLI